MTSSHRSDGPGILDWKLCCVQPEWYHRKIAMYIYMKFFLDKEDHSLFWKLCENWELIDLNFSFLKNNYWKRSAASSYSHFSYYHNTRHISRWESEETNVWFKELQLNNWIKEFIKNTHCWSVMNKNTFLNKLIVQSFLFWNIPNAIIFLVVITIIFPIPFPTPSNEY